MSPINIVKIPFQIESYSSAEDKFPPQDLVNLTQSGWQSARFSPYPQTIEFKLNTYWKLLKIQILVHHYKIPSRIDLLIHSQDEWNKLGYVSLADGSAKNYTSRELKSIHVDSVVNRLQLSIHKCHLNHLNIYNQVSSL